MDPVYVLDERVKPCPEKGWINSSLTQDSLKPLIELGFFQLTEREGKLRGKWEAKADQNLDITI